MECHLQIRQELKAAKRIWPGAVHALESEQLVLLIKKHGFSIRRGDVQMLNGRWYVTHTGLLGLAYRRHCCGVQTRAVSEFCDPVSSRWTFKAIVFKSRVCKGFVGYGDADPGNVSSLVRGAEMRVAETRAVNRALRKAYGIGICSVEEIGALPARSQPEANVRKLPPQPLSGNGQLKLRDQLCLLIRQHQLDASLVKQYAAEFCGTKDVRQATREQIQSFITHLAELAGKDRNGLLCKLNSYGQKPEEGAA
jgi:hypothetical protein